MKHLTTKHIIAIVTVIVLIVAALAITLSLTMWRYEEPDLSEYGSTTGGEQGGRGQEVRSPFGMYDYSKRPFFSSSFIHGVPYKNDVYFLDTWSELSRVSLNELTCEMKTETEIVLPEQYSVCPDVSHGHHTFSISAECPGNVNGTFVLDAYESAGDYPIFYYVGAYREATNSAEEWNPYETYDFYRYDSGNNTRELLYASPNPIGHMMSYDQSIYFVAQTAANEYSVNRIAKSGGEVTTVSVGNDGASFLGVYDEQIVFRDGDATIYKADLDLKNCEEIYQVEEELSLSMFYGGFDSAFLHDGYLYFTADYDTVPYALSDHQTKNLFNFSVRRLPLDDLSSEGELVVEKVFDNGMLGVIDNVFYYIPCEPGETIDEYYWNFSGGKIRGIDLDTLETVFQNEDTGLAIGGNNTFLCGYGIVDNFFRLDGRYNLVYQDAAAIRCIYDIQTGALYPIFTTA